MYANLNSLTLEEILAETEEKALPSLRLESDNSGTKSMDILWKPLKIASQKHIFIT